MPKLCLRITAGRIWDRDGLTALASRTAESGISITVVGVGLDFDEQTMTAMAAIRAFRVTVACRGRRPWRPGAAPWRSRPR